MAAMFHTEIVAMNCDSEAKKLHEAADAAKEAYVKILESENASDELKALRKANMKQPANWLPLQQKRPKWPNANCWEET